jgi:hypothetical protein
MDNVFTFNEEFHEHFSLKRSPFSDMAFGQLTQAGSGNRDLVL